MGKNNNRGRNGRSIQVTVAWIGVLVAIIGAIGIIVPSLIDNDVLFSNKSDKHSPTDKVQGTSPHIKNEVIVNINNGPLFPTFIKYTENEMSTFASRNRDFVKEISRNNQVKCNTFVEGSNYILEIEGSEDYYPLGVHDIEKSPFAKGLGDMLISLFDEYGSMMEALKKETSKNKNKLEAKFKLSLDVYGSSDNKPMLAGDVYRGQNLKCDCISEITGRRETFLMKYGTRTANFWLGCARAGAFTSYLLKYKIKVPEEEISLTGVESNNEGGRYRKITARLTFHHGVTLFEKYGISKPEFCP